MKTKVDEKLTNLNRAKVFCNSGSSKEKNFSNPPVRKNNQIISRHWNERVRTEALTKHRLDMHQIYVILKVTLRKRNLEWEKLKEKTWNAMSYTLNEALKKIFILGMCDASQRSSKSWNYTFVIVTRNWVSTEGMKTCHKKSEQKEKSNL